MIALLLINSNWSCQFEIALSYFFEVAFLTLKKSQKSHKNIFRVNKYVYTCVKVYLIVYLLIILLIKFRQRDSLISIECN